MGKNSLLKEDLLMSSIVFAKPLDSNLKCVVCKELLRRPKQTTCGHRLCEDCLETMKKHSPKQPLRCPVDDTELALKDIFHDRCCERDILMLQCLCVNSKKGCSWLGELGALLKEHVSRCEYSMVKCPNEHCKETMEKRQLEDHAKNTCEYRLQTCENCEAKVAQAKLKIHLSQCPGVSEQCTLGCGATVIRRDMEKHVTTECLNAPVPCPLQQYGCDFEGSRGDLEKHNEDNLAKHIQIMGEYNSKYVDNAAKMEEKINKLESEKDHLHGQVQASREALALTKQDFQTLQIKLGIMEKHLEKQKTNMEQLRETLQSLQNQAQNDTAIESQLTEIVSLVQNQEKRFNDLAEQEGSGASPRSYGYASNSERRLDRNEHMSATNEVRIAEHDLRIQMLEATSYDGSYLWKIDDWSRRLHEAQIGKTTSLYSPPFHVGRYGYKVCARLYPCGDGIGKGTHISMFFVVMKGEYDSLLPWPFRHKVTFQLIDPSRKNDITDTFRPDQNSSSFQKPKGSMNIASGTPQFVSHNMLTSGGYIVDNTLFIKISVDKTGLVEF